MRKRIFVLLAVLVVLVAFSGCSLLDSFTGGSTEGGIGDTLKTEWFSFSVDSAETATEYAGYTPEDGNMLLDLVVTVTNTTDDEIEMYDADFYLDDPADTEYYVFSLDPIDDTMMPLAYPLAPDETVTYHLVFEVSADSEGFKLLYTEEGVDGSGNEVTGDTYTVDVGI